MDIPTGVLADIPTGTMPAEPSRDEQSPAPRCPPYVKPLALFNSSA
jgi:hypothetical protein